MEHDRKLWVFGDSFSETGSGVSERSWSMQLTGKLKDRTSVDIELRDISLIGCSQDWILERYLSVVDKIHPQDHVIIVMTSPERYWFFQNQPDLTNWNIIDLGDKISREQALAIEYYYKYINRQEMSILHSTSRLGMIAYQTRIRSLRKPLIMNGFDHLVYPSEIWPDLDFAQGCLAEVQFKEYQDSQNAVDEKTQITGWFKGYDCRFNHLCLSNHDVLSDKLANYMLDGTPVDLTRGFHEEIVDKKWYEDPDFIKKELNPKAVEHFITHIYNKTNVLPWKVRVGLAKN